MDAKACHLRDPVHNLQTVLGEGRRLLLVPVDSLLNKACTSIIYLCSFVRFKLGYLGPIDPSSKFSGHFATGARVRGTGKFGYLSVTTRVVGPKPAGIQLLKGAGSRRVSQQIAGCSDKVTIQQYRRNGSSVPQNQAGAEDGSSALQNRAPGSRRDSLSASSSTATSSACSTSRGAPATCSCGVQATSTDPGGQQTRVRLLPAGRGGPETR